MVLVLLTLSTMPPGTREMGTKHKRDKIASPEAFRLEPPSEVEGLFGLLPYSNEANYGQALITGIPFLTYCEAMAGAWAFSGKAPADSSEVYKVCAEVVSCSLYDGCDESDPDWGGLAHSCAVTLVENGWTPTHPYVSLIQIIAERQGRTGLDTFEEAVESHWFHLCSAPPPENVHPEGESLIEP